MPFATMDVPPDKVMVALERTVQLGALIDPEPVKDRFVPDVLSVSRQG